MSDTVVWLEIKKEFEANLVGILYPYIYEGIRCMYNFAKKKAIQNNKENNIISIFQKYLESIRDWDIDMVIDETHRIKKESGTEHFLDKLVRAVIETQIILLTCSNKVSPSICTHFFDNFSSSILIHKCYIECGKDAYNNPFLYYHGCHPIEYKRNQILIGQYIQEGITRAIKKVLPLGLILDEFLENSSKMFNNKAQFAHNIFPQNNCFAGVADIQTKVNYPVINKDNIGYNGNDNGAGAYQKITTNSSKEKKSITKTGVKNNNHFFENDDIIGSIESEKYIENKERAEKLLNIMDTTNKNTKGNDYVDPHKPEVKPQPNAHLHLRLPHSKVKGPADTSGVMMMMSNKIIQSLADIDIENEEFTYDKSNGDSNNNTSKRIFNAKDSDKYNRHNNSKYDYQHSDDFISDFEDDNDKFAIGNMRNYYHSDSINPKEILIEEYGGKKFI
jgi:hypothetical protein